MPANRWKVEDAPNEIGDLPMELSRPSVENVTWFLLDVYGKMWEERGELK